MIIIVSKPNESMTNMLPASIDIISDLPPVCGVRWLFTKATFPIEFTKTMDIDLSNEI